MSQADEGKEFWVVTRIISKATTEILGKHFWATGYGVWSTGNITDEMVQQYLEHHRSKDDKDDSDFILE